MNAENIVIAALALAQLPRPDLMADNVVLAAFALPVLLAGIIYLYSAYYRARSNRAQRWLWLGGGNALLLLFLLSLVLLSGECYYRFVYDTTDAFGMSRTSRAWFQRHWHVNNVGVRDSVDVARMNRPTTRHRITFVGDSFTNRPRHPRRGSRRFVNLIRRPATRLGSPCPGRDRHGHR